MAGLWQTDIWETLNREIFLLFYLCTSFSLIMLHLGYGNASLIRRGAELVLVITL